MYIYVYIYTYIHTYLYIYKTGVLLSFHRRAPTQDPYAYTLASNSLVYNSYSHMHIYTYIRRMC